MFSSTLLVTYILSRTVAKLLQIIFQICAFDNGVPVFNAVFGDDPLNSALRNFAQETKNVALS